MIRLRKYGGIAVLLLAILLALQAGISLLARTHRMKENLIAHLESAFGRPVQAGRFSVQILPIPELEVDNVTIGEDPAFGHEYFLRAEQMTAGFSWLGLLRGHIEFGTMSFTRPSLILVRNAEGRWNLERWLPPAAPAASRGSTSSGVSAAPRAEATYHLQKIDFDDGRINFKLGDEKRPFAFTNVSGSVEQVSPGRNLLHAPGNVRERKRPLLVAQLEVNPTIVEVNFLQMIGSFRSRRSRDAGRGRAPRSSRSRWGQPALQIPTTFRVAH